MGFVGEIDKIYFVTNVLTNKRTKCNTVQRVDIWRKTMIFYDKFRYSEKAKKF